ncbi:MAG: indolepyruvate ferredoxin oxidoreductase subunit alpha [Candidatus Nealsonbacteria bacterium CG23_combo_of_CG06-09_8_20_14_all_37_18]|uniref:Indolepyruvate oxidoreductase subunit IorA n=4 Tax=Candidatus Nealsoniibacteriota TaxID=1817911 RepID=A0A2G9YY61_9BACT|nr:MAG: indolepyruvate ferredoxin oxidoreductase subunit alpha [Candidatus Nealsonbacteria bacterium CG23_combo_of_CG06-09_8_20_14_all_37_18]
MEEILLQKPGKKIILLGNEAIVRGALEAGCQFVSTYPGTPASEIGNTFFKLSRSGDYKGYFEFSTNEKVALEAGIGASFSGLKTLIAMKNFGLNVCFDALIPFVYTGAKGPTVIIVADDPSCHSSAQSEENSRAVAFLAHIPILEPSDPQECKDFTKLAFQISERYKIPIIIRTTTRVAHQKMPVKLGEWKKNPSLEGRFVKDPGRFVTLPPRVLEMKKELLEKIEKIKQFSEKSSVNPLFGTISREKLGIITSGVSYLYVMEALKELNLELPVLKLGFFYPLPEEKIKNFIKNFKKILVVEELEPFLEKELFSLAKQSNCKLKVIGKELLPEVGELKPEYVISAIAKFTGIKYQMPHTKYRIPASKRLPQLCPGCPYWLVISAIKRAVDVKKVIFGGEIGCYMLFGNSPVNLQDYLSCMGSSVGIAHGIKKAGGQKIISFVGDSSFFHAGIPALINTVFNKSNPLIIILENQTTAMTGHQPHPGAPVEPNGIKIEEIVKACGVKNVRTIDQINQEEFVKTVKEFLAKEEVSVIIARRPCIFVAKK